MRELTQSAEACSESHPVNGWQVSAWTTMDLSSSEREFARIELGEFRTPSYYERRIARYSQGSPADVMLDAGCGIGQWSVAGAMRFKRVLGIDIDERRLNLARALADSSQARNTDFACCSLEALPIPDATIDFIVCYGVVNFTKVDQVFGEFLRVLKPGGILYVNANSIAWYSRYAFRGVVEAVHAFRIILRTFSRRGAYVTLSRRNLVRRLRNAGFEVLETGPEGTVRTMGGGFQPAYPERALGMAAVSEALAAKPDGPPEGLSVT